MEPESPPPAPTGPPPPYRLHSTTAITLATALGTPMAGGLLLGFNFWKWGQKPLAVAFVVGGILITAVLGWLAWTLPTSVPAILFLVPQVVGGYLVAKLVQGDRFDEHIRAGGREVSVAVGAGIGLAFTTMFVVAFGVWLFSSGVNPSALLDSQDSVEFGHGQEVYYSRGATRADAQTFGDALKDAGYFDDTIGTAVWIAGRVGAREISFIGREGAWADAATVDSMGQLAEYIEADIGGRPITVRLLDEALNEVKHCRLDSGWRCVRFP